MSSVRSSLQLLPSLLGWKLEVLGSGVFLHWFEPLFLLRSETGLGNQEPLSDSQTGKAPDQ